MYGSAKELFETARRCRMEIERQTRTLELMESYESVRGAGFDAIRTSGTSDPMAATDARMDHERRIRLNMEECDKTLDYAWRVLYGEDYLGMSGGLSSLTDKVYAEVLDYYYCMAMSWSDAARLIGYARTPTIERAKRALHLIDEYGFNACIEGIEYAGGCQGT